MPGFFANLWNNYVAGQMYQNRLATAKVDAIAAGLQGRSGIQTYNNAVSAANQAFKSSIVPLGHGATFDDSTMSVPAANAVSTGSGSASGVASGSSVSTAPSVNSFAFEGAPITSAVSVISDPEVRANAFNEMMSNSAHQREVKDLIAAGLNPVLSAKYGGAGSSAYQAVEQAAASSRSGGASKAANGFLGLPMINNPSKPWQIAYNLVVANGDKILNLSQNSARNFDKAYQSALKVGDSIVANSAKNA